MVLNNRGLKDSTNLDWHVEEGTGQSMETNLTGVDGSGK